MRKIFWMIIFFGIYVWVMTSGNDHILIQQGKNLYNALITWFDDAELDFQTNQPPKHKKKPRRWD